jgi:hypothetical protein
VIELGKALKIPQDPAVAQDYQHRHQQRLQRGNAHHAPHARIRHRVQKTEQIKAGLN